MPTLVPDHCFKASKIVTLSFKAFKSKLLFLPESDNNKSWWLVFEGYKLQQDLWCSLYIVTNTFLCMRKNTRKTLCRHGRVACGLNRKNKDIKAYRASFCPPSSFTREVIAFPRWSCIVLQSSSHLSNSSALFWCWLELDSKHQSIMRLVFSLNCVWSQFLLWKIY